MPPVAMVAVEQAPTVTDWMEGVGALVTALFALTAIAVSVALGRQDRRRAQQQLHEEQRRHEQVLQHERQRFADEREAAEARLRTEHQRLAEETRRQFHLQTLQRVVDAYAQLGTAPVDGHPALGRLQVDLRALPDDAVSLLRFQYGIADNSAARSKRAGIAQARSAEIRRPVPADWIFAELADDALRLLHGTGA
ncbi:hypothetical protein [Plantactinospora endophytica]|uniref:Uncharacterized protein n=1 Tax=Plantactinospora endophytica TaxID=673535 RepID=A0ABQ4DY18_9ACTN|nr:hypothetical protein [Plantactinospora endophytica]GIG87364.1 hypothetical protein Pen02_23000 [Plantactinospora endophytica]